MGVSHTTLLVSPINSKLRASSSVYALWTLSPVKMISSFSVSRGTTLGKSSSFFEE